MVTAQRSNPGPAVVTTVDVETKRALEDELAAAQVDPALWTGAFATNVWGGRYEIEGVLGNGAQGTTFVGVDRKTGAKIAAKVFDLKKAKDWKSVQLFEREVETLKQIDHPAIPKLLDVVVDEQTGARALVRTLVPGRSLASELKEGGPLSEAAVWSVLVDVADVLSALHGQRQPIVHRDLKPANLIRRPDGKVCLVDFGGVGHTRSEAGSTVVGTFGFMAPEQLYGAQTPATDIYAAGATALALATGQQPEDLPRDGLAIDVDKAAPQLSPTLRALLKKMTAPDPKERPASAQGLLAELRDVATRKEAKAQAQTTAPPIIDAELDAELEREANKQLRPHDTDIVIAVLTMVIGILGTVGAVVIGQVLVPLILTVVAQFCDPEQRAKVLRVREQVKTIARRAQRGFSDSATTGATTLEQLDHQRKLDRKRWKQERKLERERAKQQWRDLRAQQRQRRR